MSKSSIWPIDKTLIGATTPGYSGPGSDGNEEIILIHPSFSFTEASPSDCVVSYLGHSLVACDFSAEIQSVYSAALADWVKTK